MPNTLFYDCEPLGDPHILGWDAYAELGISVIACWSSIHEGFDYFIGDEGSSAYSSPRSLMEFSSMLKFHDQIIGFNSKNYDDPLCWAHEINVQTTFDLLEEVRIAAYGSPDWDVQPDGFSYKLADLAKFNLDYSKMGNGAVSAQLWREGKYQEVIDCCINDVRILKDLYELFMAGKLKDPNTDAPLIYRELGA